MQFLHLRDKLVFDWVANVATLHVIGVELLEKHKHLFDALLLLLSEPLLL